jgi:hypothetical protein
VVVPPILPMMPISMMIHNDNNTIKNVIFLDITNNNNINNRKMMEARMRQQQ